MKICSRVILLICSIFCITSLHAQKDAKIGTVNPKDFSIEHPKNKDAAAYILYKNSTIDFIGQDASIVANIEESIRYKINKSSALELANFEFIVFDDEKLKSLKAFSHNLVNGKVVTEKMNLKEFTEEKLSNGRKLYKIAAKNIKEGSIVEFYSQKHSPYIHNLPASYLQGEYPTVWAEANFTSIEYFIYQPLLYSFEELEIKESVPTTANIDISYTQSPLTTGTVIGNRVSGTLKLGALRYRWAVKDIDGISSEPFMTTLRDYAVKIDYQLRTERWPGRPEVNYNSTWNDLNTRYMNHEYFGSMLKLSDNLLKKFPDFSQEPDEKKRFEAIYNYISAKYKWNEYMGEFASQSQREFIESKTGNVADINLLLCAVSKAYNLNVYPVVLSTRNNGRLNPQFPQQSLINYVVAVQRTQDGSEIFADACHKDSPIGMLSEKCLNEYGLLVDAHQTQFLGSLKSKNKEAIVVQIDIKEDGKREVTHRSTYNYFSSMYYRNLSENAKEELKAFYEKKNAGTQTEILIPEDKSEAVVITRKYTKEEEPLEDINYLAVLEGYGYDENVFKSEVRKFPVDFPYTTQESYIFILNAPAGYTFDEIPKNEVVKMDNNMATFSFTGANEGTKVQFITKININTPFINATDYTHLRTLFDHIVKKFSEQIVLKKVQ